MKLCNIVLYDDSLLNTGYFLVFRLNMGATMVNNKECERLRFKALTVSADVDLSQVTIKPFGENRLTKPPTN